MEKGLSTAPPQGKDHPRLLPNTPEQLEPSQLSQPCNVHGPWPEDWNMSLFEAQKLLLPYVQSLVRGGKEDDALAATWSQLALSSRVLVGDSLNDPSDAHPIGGSCR